MLHWRWANKYRSHPRWARKRAVAVMPAEAVHRRDSRTVGPRRSCHHTAPSVLRLEPEASEEVCVRPGRGSPPTEHNPLRCPAEAFLPSARGQPVAPQSGLGRPAHGRGQRTLRSARWSSCRGLARDDCQAIGPTGGLVRAGGWAIAPNYRDDSQAISPHQGLPPRGLATAVLLSSCAQAAPGVTEQVRRPGCGSGTGHYMFGLPSTPAPSSRR